jgi:hypothetical protein
VFGSLLDREAGTFRFGPFGINVPTALDEGRVTHVSGRRTDSVDAERAATADRIKR